jgi:TonB family protein
MTVAEALTQHRPEWPDAFTPTPPLPPGTPADLVEIVRSCLNRETAARPSARDLLNRLAPQPRPEAPSELAATSPPAALPEGRRTTRSRPPSPLPWVAVAVLVLASGWAARHLLQTHLSAPRPATDPSQPTAISAPQPMLSPTPSAASAPAVTPGRDAPGAEVPADQSATAEAQPVLHEEPPSVSPGSLATIHGRIKISVRVSVDADGNVIDATLEHAGPSAYFARHAVEAAAKWKFVPAPGQPRREWLLWFEFDRGGTSAKAKARGP